MKRMIHYGTPHDVGAFPAETVLGEKKRSKDLGK